MRTLLDSFWREDRAPGARGPGRGDWLLSGVVALVAVTEGLLDDAIVWRVFSTALMVALAMLLPWRRVAPLGVVVLGFGATALVHAVCLLAGVRWEGLGTTGVVMLLLPYALLRWGSGREAVLGLATIALSFVTAMWGEGHGWGEALGASLFLLFPAALGATLRYRDSAARRAREQVRLHERERLARELHDTVAHHVSAIAVQAQAGRALAATDPRATLGALAAIEEAASRTLSDMRRMVSTLRADGDAPRAPTASLAEIRRLAADGLGGVPVEVTLGENLDDLDAGLQSALYRLVQEAVTNARRHARDASRIRVRVKATDGQVRLTVEDDGAPVARAAHDGFGLRGMRERVDLLGGTLHAGPGDAGGWSVRAVLPREADGA